MTTRKTLSTSPRKIADLETVFGRHWRKLWNHIKAETHSTIRCPASVNVHADVRALCINDNHLCRRFAWDMETGELSAGVHVSTGEWAVHAGSNNDGAVNSLPRNAAIITVEWTDYHRYMALDVQVHPEALPASLPA